VNIYKYELRQFSGHQGSYATEVTHEVYCLENTRHNRIGFLKMCGKIDSDFMNGTLDEFSMFKIKEIPIKEFK